MKLNGKKIVILVEEIFNDHEFWYPYYQLKEAAAEVTVVGSGSSEIYTGKSGTKASADLSADNIDVSDYDGIVIPGGYAPDHMSRNPAMVKLVKAFYEAGKPIAAICHAGWMLVSAGILKGKKITSYFTQKNDLITAGNRGVIVDGCLVTSMTSYNLQVFMETFFNMV